MQLGFLLMVIGFGAAVMRRFTAVQFPLMSWLNSSLPTAGVVVGLAGLAVVAVAVARRARSKLGDRLPR